MRNIFNKIRDILRRIELKEKEREEAMLSRKPIENINCASCDGKMSEMRGIKAKFLDWQNFPKTDSNLKISQMGKGYSRFLNLMKKQEGDSDDETLPKK